MNTENNKILVTGAAGFIGFHLVKALLEQGNRIIGVDNLNSYYDVELKKARLNVLQESSNFCFHQLDLADRRAMDGLFKEYRPVKVVNLAAQAGVRYSLENPQAYVDSNVAGFLNVLEGCRGYGVEHLVYASSSSVYGNNTKVPFAVTDNVDHPVSLYAATKRSNELMAYTYSHLYKIPTTGLRFFTVYGPWGRPDMAYFKFTGKILAGEPIEVYNYGKHKRDFTYIDDIVDGIIKVLYHVPGESQQLANGNPPYRLYNIGNNKPVELLHFIHVLEDCLGKKAELKLLHLQPGDVEETFADIDDLARDTGFKPTTSIEEGLREFVGWYREFYGAKVESSKFKV